MVHATIGRVATALSSSRRAINVGLSKRSFSILTASEEFPDLPPITYTTPTSGTPSQTLLPSGLTVITEDASPTTTISVTFPGAGSASESSNEMGAALVNKYLSFKSGSSVSSLVILRTLENAGATPFTFASRMGAGMGFSMGSGDDVEGLVPLLAVECGFETWDVKDAKKTSGSACEVAMGSVQSVLTEQLYSAAYGAQSPLGHSLYTPSPSASTLASFRSRTYVPSCAILAATGISDHDKFVSTVADAFGAASDASSPPAADATYRGGESRAFAPTGYAHVAVALEGPSSSALAGVVTKVLALGSGPGVAAFGVPGLVGLYAHGPSVDVDDMCKALEATVTSDVVARAKSLAKADAMFKMTEGSRSLAGVMTASVMETGAFSVEGMAKAYDEITEADVKGALAEMLKSNPSMVAMGDITDVPYHATVAAKFK